MSFQTIFSEAHDKEDTTTFVERVDSVLKLLNEHWGEYPDKMVTNHFPRLQKQVDGVIRFALTVHKLMKSGEFATSISKVVNQLTSRHNGLSFGNILN